MLSPSTLAAWCYVLPAAVPPTPDAGRVAALITERDAVMSNSVLNDGEGISGLLNAAGNGKSAAYLIHLPATDKLELLTETLRLLGVIPDTLPGPVTMTHAGFAGLIR